MTTSDEIKRAVPAFFPGAVASLDSKTDNGKRSLIISRTMEKILINDDTAILYRSRSRHCSIGDHRVRAY
jgi:hypothetical protein